MSGDDYKKILGIGPNSTPEEIKKSYRALVRIYHPDNPDTGNAEKFREIHHAYKMVTDPSYAYKDVPKIQPVILKTNINIRQAVFGARFVHNLTKVNISAPKEGETDDTVTHPVIELVDVIPKHTLKFPHAIIRSNVNFDGKKITVIVTYMLDEDPYYKVTPDGEIYVNLEIEALQALKGDKVEIPTLFGIRKLRIPAGTIPGDTLLIKNHGDLPPLMVKISDIKYPRKAQMQGNEDYNSLGINWKLEEEAEKKEQQELDELFNKLGGKPEV